MATRLPMADEIPFSMQIKTLGDEELLDFWAETQQIEHNLQEQYQHQVVPALDYEKIIVMELQLRSCQKQKHI